MVGPHSGKSAHCCTPHRPPWRSWEIVPTSGGLLGYLLLFVLCLHMFLYPFPWTLDVSVGSFPHIVVTASLSQCPLPLPFRKLLVDQLLKHWASRSFHSEYLLYCQVILWKIFCGLIYPLKYQQLMFLERSVPKLALSVLHMYMRSDAS